MIRRLLLAWQLSRELSYVSDFDFSDWNEIDRSTLEHFFATPTGAKFRQLHQSQAQKVAAWATRQKDTARACGHALGVAAIVTLHDQLLPVKEEPAPRPEEEFAGYLEELRP